MEREEKEFLEKIINYNSGGRLERGTISPAALFNGLGKHQKDKLIHKLISFDYIEEVPTRVNDDILNFYRVSEKGYGIFDPWYKKFWRFLINDAARLLSIVAIILSIIATIVSLSKK